MWSDIVAMTGYSPNIRVIVDLSDVEVFHTKEDRAKSVSRRWGSELIAGVVISDRQFANGFEELKIMLPFSNLCVIRTNEVPVMAPDQTKKDRSFFEKEVQLLQAIYLQHTAEQDAIDQEDFPENLELLQFCKQYYKNVLQTPLEPLHDNLESQVYEIFEKDLPKYKHYQVAIANALMELKSERDNETIRIIIIGAGRGPLVDASLRAAYSLGIMNICEIYAVEKNPCAMVTLEHLKDEIWKDLVTLVHFDIRNWQKCPELFALEGTCDIMVSELLGSPECIQSAWKLLRHHKGICIPQSYTSFIQPISCAQIWQNANHASALEQPHVVYLNNNCFSPVPAAQACFTYSHSASSSTHQDLSPCTTLFFPIDTDFVLHGLLGSFSAELFAGVQLSTIPTNHTVGLLSWFPIYFPLRQPVQIPRGSILQVNLWRTCSSEHDQVRYEWSINRDVVHNVSAVYR
jgi:protein arginine N-methyltransferase 5